MKYLGKLYGKVSGHYVPLEGTGEEVDQMETAFKATRRQLEIAVETLKDISEGTQPADLVAEDALDEINKVGGS